MCTQIAFGLYYLVISPNWKAEVNLRRNGCHLEKCIWRHNGPIWTKFGTQTQNGYQQCRYAVSWVAYGVRMFCCVTTAMQHQTLSVRFCVPFAGRVAGYATSRLLQRNTRRTSCVSAQSTSVSAQCRRQTDTSIFSVWARHTNTARPTLAAVSGRHRFQVSCAHLPMPARPGATVSLRLYPERRRFQPPPSPVVVILAASDPTYAAVHCWRSCVSGCRKPPLKQSAARRHLSFNAVFRNCLKTHLFPDHFLPNCFRLLVLHTVYSSHLAVFVL